MGTGHEQQWALIGISLCFSNLGLLQVATRIVMTHGVLKEFDLVKESIEHFRERFEFYCVANKFRSDGDDLRQEKALLGHSTFKLKVFASPTPVSDLRWKP